MAPRKILVVGGAVHYAVLRALDAGKWLAENPLTLANTNDPHTPQPRSKGEKARNRRNRK